MARPRFKRATAAERKATLRRYHKARERGKSPTAAARAAGTDLTTIERWIDKASAPVTITRDRKCLGGCGEMFKSEHPGNRICPRCSGRFAALPAAWSA